jgi:chromosome segregation ATPase
VARKPEAGDVVDDLLAIPPKRFTAARNAAAKEVAAGGDREAAAEIKGLPRPTLALWSLNRVAHEHSDLVAAFIDAAAKLRKAHESGGDIRAATRPEREAEGRVAEAAVQVAAGEGAATETVMRGIRQALGAAAADPEVAATLRAGRLIREPEAPSIDQLLGSLTVAPAGSKAKAPSKSDRQERRRALRDEVAEAKADAADAREAARGASDAATAARREWEQAQRAAEKAERQSEKANERLDELQQRLKDL